MFGSGRCASLVVGLVLILGAAGLGDAWASSARANEPVHASREAGVFRVYVGTYTSGGSKSRGIYLMELDAGKGTLSRPQLVAKSADPSFLAIHPSARFLYAANEVGTLSGRPGGGVSAYAIDSATGALSLLNQVSSAGGYPCHLVVDPAGKNVLVANYGTGTVACLPIESDGRLRPASAAIQHKGKGAVASRQEGPHAHSINVDPSGTFAYAADLGIDKVMIYRFDSGKGALAAADPAFAAMEPGSGPRHFAIRRDGTHAYVINELANTVVAFGRNSTTGALERIQSISTLPADFRGGSATADVHLHPSGKFLYGSNRGHDSIAVYGVDSETGKLSLVEIEPTQGKAPRNFAIDPTGRWLLAENQDSDSVVVFQIDAETGKLEATGVKAEVPRPVCIQMISRP